MNAMKTIGDSFGDASADTSVSLSINQNPDLQDIVANNSMFSIRGDMTMTQNNKLTSIHLKGLARVGGSITISTNPVTVIDLSGLVCVDSITISNNPSLNMVYLTNLTGVTDSVLFSPAVVTNCDMCVGSETNCARCGACLSCSGGSCGCKYSNSLCCFSLIIYLYS
jgi:hypothetical protein